MPMEAVTCAVPSMLSWENSGDTKAGRRAGMGKSTPHPPAPSPASAVHCAPCCHLVVEEEKTRAMIQRVSKPICPMPSRLPGRSCPLQCAQSTEAPLGKYSIPWVLYVVVLKCVSCFLGIP